MRQLLLTTLLLAIFATAQAQKIEKLEPSAWITPCMWIIIPGLIL